MDVALLALGNPLLDIVLKCDSDLISKYNLPFDGAIEVDSTQMPLFDEISKYERHQKPGGSAQNTCRIARAFLDTTEAVVFLGCVGRDQRAKTLEALVSNSGVTTIYMYDSSQPTGISVGLVHGQHRSLCAHIGAANYFTVNHFSSPDVDSAMSSTRVIYVEGFFLTHSYDSARYAALYASRNKKTFALNFSAVYISKNFCDGIAELLPFCHVMIGNGDEIGEFCQKMKFPCNDVREMAASVCGFRFEGTESEFTALKNCRRCVVVTRGSLPLIVAIGDEIRVFDVPQIEKEKIVDTVGAGDGFVGGFLAAMSQNKDLEECVKVGLGAAMRVVQKEGCDV